jgi:hypothetical protein
MKPSSMGEHLSRRAPLLAALALAALGLAVFMVPARSPRLIGVITDISRYQEVRASFGGSPLANHFPEVIPPQATNVQITYVPGLFQGGTVFQLRLTLSPQRIADLQLQYEELATHIFSSDYEPTSLNDVPIPILRSRPESPDDAQGEFQFLIIDAHPQGDPDFPWNHGYSYGVALSTNTSEIVYWTEDW